MVALQRHQNRKLVVGYPLPPLGVKCNRPSEQTAIYITRNMILQNFQGEMVKNLEFRYKFRFTIVQRIYNLFYCRQHEMTDHCLFRLSINLCHGSTLQ